MSKEDNTSFGENVSRIRKSKGLTQSDLAKSLNLTIHSLKSWEYNVNTDPKLSSILSLMEALNVPFEHLVDHEHSVSDSLKKFEEYFHEIAKLSPKKKQLLLALIKTFLEN